MLTESLVKIYLRDLSVLRSEIESYPDEAAIWRVDGSIKNSAGNLCIHICGNLQHFIGAVLGKSGYVRDRDAEFASNGISRSDLLDSIKEAEKAVGETLASLTTDDLSAIYPIEVFGHPMTTEYFLLHLTTHLTYHLGQINYHRRLLAT